MTIQEQYNTWASRLFDLLSLQLDRLAIDKNPLPLVWLRLPPLADFRSKLQDNLLLRALQQYSRWLRRAGRHALWHWQLNRM